MEKGLWKPANNKAVVIVEDTDKLFRRVCDVIKGLERDAVGQCGIAEDADDVLTAAALVACGGHAQCRRQCRAGVAGAVNQAEEIKSGIYPRKSGIYPTWPEKSKPLLALADYITSRDR